MPCSYCTHAALVLLLFPFLLDKSGSFGKFSKTLTRPRVMEFALRYTF